MLNQVQHDGMIAALTLALSFFIAAPVMAADTPPVPASAQTDNSAYTLTKVEQTGTNVITKYEWSDTENKLVPQYYRVDLNKTEYGYPDIADETKTFTVTTPNADGSGNAFEYEIKYYVDQNRVKPDRITEDMDLMGADINNDFVGQNNTAYDSIIDNTGTIGNITGDFVGNSLIGATGYSSAAITNDGTINNIVGNFIGNYRASANSPYAGAISNYGSISSITGNFIGNYSYGSGTGQWNSFGGAIYNWRTIGNITGNFIGNYAYSASTSWSYGGAIYNNGGSTGTAIINNINADFIGNYVSTPRARGYGGAIYNNNGTIGNITGDFICNYTSARYEAQGGAIYNKGINAIIGNITGDFIGNYATSSSYAYGGAIYNYEGTIGDITGDFIGNYAFGTGGYYNDTQGGAIYNYDGTIGNITGDYIGNYVSSTDSSTYGGAIYNYRGTIGNITGDFIGNYASSIDYSARGGAIFNRGTIGAKDDDGNVIGGLINSSFINNYAKSETGEAKGGAIYTSKSLNIIAKDGGQSVFSGNYVRDKDGKRQEAIYVNNNISAGSTQTEVVSVDADKIIYQEKSSNFDSYDPADNPTLTLNANTNGTISFDDQISGDNSNLVNNTYQMNIIGMAQDFSGNEHHRHGTRLLR